MIRSKQTKSNSKLLPFQLYHQNKSISKPSTHTKNNVKSYYEDSSTQLPSIIKNSHVMSSKDTSRLYGVEENDDD